MAWQCDPQVTVDANGQEQVTGFGVFHDRQGVLDNQGQVLGMEDDYVEFEDGSIHHRFENIEFDEEEELIYDDDDSEYIAALHELNPELMDAVEWSKEAFTEEEAAWYNECIDEEGLDGVNEAIEYLLDRYNYYVDNLVLEPEDFPDVDEFEEEYYEEEEEYETESEWDSITEEQEEQLEAVTSELLELEPNPEVADEWQEVCVAAAESGDETLASVAAAIRSVHESSMTQEEAINYVLSNYPPDEVERVWNYLNS